MSDSGLRQYEIPIKKIPKIQTSQKPIIGILAKHNDNGSKFSEGNQYSFVSDDLTFAIGESGGTPFVIPSISKEILYGNNDSNYTSIPITEKENLISLIKLCDGIILQGGKESDVYEIFVAKYCYDNNIPIIGICAGQNNLARAVGGKSKPLSDQEKEKHNRGFYDLSHNVRVDNTSLFSKMTGGATSFSVNSIHTNVIDESSLEGTELNVVACDDDGHLEVFERKGNEPYIGIRFHPECLTGDREVGEIMKNFFSNFIKLCREKKLAREISKGDSIEYR